MSRAAISVEELRVRYPNAAGYAVDGMSFTVAAGEVFGFLGPNGAGKSTTQRVLTRLLRDHEGQAAVLGRPVRQWGPDYYERIGVGFELPAHFAKLTARENLAAFAALYRGPVEDPMAMLDRVGLAGAADQRAGTFSKGMQMRLDLARALLHRPDVLFLDEPTSGLDPVHATQVRELIRAHADSGGAAFLTTHDMATAEQLCDRVAFVLGGRIAATDTPRDFKRAHGTRQVAIEYRGGGRLHHEEVPVNELGSQFLELARSGKVESIHTREASLDEVFIAITGNHL